MSEEQAVTEEKPEVKVEVIEPIAEKPPEPQTEIPAEEKPEKKDRFQKRIDKLTREKYELKGRVETLEKMMTPAKQHAREALIVEKAGQQHTDRLGKTCGNVTIATNMAGRGTDIKLAPGVANIGGLHILGTERHEARRIDNQLRGRSGRQGDAGSSQFFLSFDDDLMKLFGGDKIPKLLSLVGWKENEPIFNRTISRQIEKVQKKVEQRNSESRKSLLDYDEVMDYQRKTLS